MKGRDLGVAMLVAAQLFAAPPVVAQAEQPAEAKDADEAPPVRKKKVLLSKETAERRYRQAKKMEARGDEKGALKAYLAAGESGHGLAQKRLGEIYEKGNSATRRDYDTALRWYEKARAQGIEIPKPIAIQKGR